MRATEEVPFAQWLRQKQQAPEQAPLVSTGADLDTPPPRPPRPPRRAPRTTPGDGNRLCQCCLLMLAGLMIPAIVIVAMRPTDPDGDIVTETLAIHGSTLTSVVMHGRPLPPPAPPSGPSPPSPPPPVPSMPPQPKSPPEAPSPQLPPVPPNRPPSAPPPTPPTCLGLDDACGASTVGTPNASLACCAGTSCAVAACPGNSTADYGFTCYACAGGPPLLPPPPRLPPSPPPSPPPPSPPPDAPGNICTNMCDDPGHGQWGGYGSNNPHILDENGWMPPSDDGGITYLNDVAQMVSWHDGECKDGGPGSVADHLCAYGTDCYDCGPRILSPPPPRAPPALPPAPPPARPCSWTCETFYGDGHRERAEEWCHEEVYATTQTLNTLFNVGRPSIAAAGQRSRNSVNWSFTPCACAVRRVGGPRRVARRRTRKRASCTPRATCRPARQRRPSRPCRPRCRPRRHRRPWRRGRPCTPRPSRPARRRCRPGGAPDDDSTTSDPSTCFQTTSPRPVRPMHSIRTATGRTMATAATTSRATHARHVLVKWHEGIVESMPKKHQLPLHQSGGYLSAHSMRVDPIRLLEATKMPMWESVCVLARSQRTRTRGTMWSRMPPSLATLWTIPVLARRLTTRRACAPLRGSTRTARLRAADPMP